jgi:hypothetical protein
MNNIFSYLFKHLIFHFLISVITIIIFVMYLKSTDYSGGEVGMAPFAIAILCLITIGISISVNVILKFFAKELSPFISSLNHILIFSLILIFYFGGNPFKPKEYLRDIDLWAILSCIISVIILNLGIKIQKNFV